MPLEIVRIPVLSDNYVWLVHEPVSGETMAVDPAVAEPVLAEAQQRGWQITQIWNTHWHPSEYRRSKSQCHPAAGVTPRLPPIAGAPRSVSSARRRSQKTCRHARKRRIGA